VQTQNDSRVEVAFLNRCLCYATLSRFIAQTLGAVGCAHACCPVPPLPPLAPTSRSPLAQQRQLVNSQASLLGRMQISLSTSDIFRMPIDSSHTSVSSRTQPLQRRATDGRRPLRTGCPAATSFTAPNCHCPARGPARRPVPCPDGRRCPRRPPGLGRCAAHGRARTMVLPRRASRSRRVHGACGSLHRWSSIHPLSSLPPVVV